MSQFDDENKPVEKKYYTQYDLLAFEPPNLYSSIGKMSLSNKKSAPMYGFGTSNRQKQQKVFHSEEFSRTQFVGKTSPGPNYEVRESDKFYFKEDPRWSFGKQERKTLGTGTKYAYFTRADVDFDPIEADATRKPRSAIAKIGLESRFRSTPRYKGTPGPDYNPNLRPEIPNPPKFSFGARREIKGASPLVLLAGTPNQVGPGSYGTLKPVATSNVPELPQYSFPKDKKLRNTASSVQKNQTYDCRISVGPQVASKNRTMPQVSFGKAKRDVHTGVFKDMMSKQPTSIRIPHPKF